MISPQDGKKLVNLARQSILLSFKSKNPDLSEYSKFSTPQGVFVTLHKNGQLRGCIGFPIPSYPLNEAIVKAAVLAAFDDPRFPQLSMSESENIDIELSVLTVPEKILIKKPEEYLNHITIGTDGLIVKNRFASGLLLPQVAPECGFGKKEFIEATCEKAGLSGSAWKESSIEIYKFQAQIFHEEKKQIIVKRQ